MALTSLFDKHKPSKKELNRFAKYWLGGGVYFWSGYIIFATLYGLAHWNWIPAKIIADAVGWSSNYFIQRKYAFADQIHLKEIEHLSRYLIIEAVGFILDYFIVGGLKSIGITPYIGLFISSIFFTFWSYAWYKYWVFPNKNKSKSK